MLGCFGLGFRAEVVADGAGGAASWVGEAVDGLEEDWEEEKEGGGGGELHDGWGNMGRLGVEGVEGVEGVV